ncbi:homoserine O-acetyltransferase [Sinomonas sp. JGH33]|uniref:Homoserine O-acetyltransferase n=1 Tax=Sinomonas terricola TaxID=3110330 RepID=A0ABU5T502_9MICC|nr:homoserine O-acetyltransferase [Sinomonas sp. JGH33]MEA5454655.1 homoserine O-acetyltransferase [Sinomonas sp. JGH33]
MTVVDRVAAPAEAPASAPRERGEAAPGLERDGVLRTCSIGALQLEAGGALPEVELAYETWGTLNADASNAVLIQHALTGDTHVAQGHADQPGWWDSLVGPGKPVDTDRYFVVAANMIGGCYGSTGPASPDPDGLPWGSRFPFVTIRDSVRAEARLADRLGIRRWHAVVGGSMGGARALEWGLTYPHRVRHCVVVAIGAYSTAEQIALAQAQVLAIRQDPNYRDGDYYGAVPPNAGLGLARRIAHISYRSEPEFSFRFGRRGQGAENPIEASDGAATRGRYQVESYLDHQADKLVRRFDANSYVILTEALMSHDVGRGRGGAERALSAAGSEFFIASVTSDRLYFPEQSEQLARWLPGEVPVYTIDAKIGHDGFLTEIGQLGPELRRRVFTL